jgi:hypothetical protein
VTDITTMTDLQDRIKELQLQEKEQMAALKMQARLTAEGLRPSNLVKNAFSDMAASKTLKQNALKASVGLGAGMLVKKLITFNSQGIFRKIAGFALQSVTTKLIAKKLPLTK